MIWDEHGDHLGEVPPIPTVMWMSYICHHISEDHEVHGALILNAVLGRALLLPILGFGYPAVQDKHLCRVVDPYLKRMTKIWDSFVEVNRAKEPAEKDRKSMETYEDLWKGYSRRQVQNSFFTVVSKKRTSSIKTKW